MAEEVDEFKVVWEEAFSLYQEKTKRDLKNDPVLSSLQSTEDLLKQIEIREQGFSTFRLKKAKFWAVLRGAMRGVELVGSITENALTLTPFSYASPVLGAVLFLVTSAKGVSEAYDCIMNLLSQLEDFTGRLEEYTKAVVEAKLRKKVVNILTTLMEIFARSEKLIKNGRFKQYMSVTFLGGNEKVAKPMERLKALIESETRLVGSLTYSTALRTRDAVDRSERTLQKTDKTTERNERKLEGIVSSMNDSKRDAKEKEEQELLSTALDDKILVKVRDKHDDVTERRLSGTGEWIKDEPLYQKWIHEETPMLWILGGPGAGKSFLSSSIISHLQEVYPSGVQRPSRVSVAYFYIKEDDLLLRSVNAILKVVALQLIASDVVFRNFAADVCKSPENIASAKRTWDNLFLNFFRSRQSRDSVAYVVIDGLDEAPRKEREILLELLYSLEKARSRRSAEYLRLQFAMVGRPELRESISSTWDSHIIFIEVSAAKNSVDIKNYILKNIDRVKALHLKKIPLAERKELRIEVIDMLEKGANGMFLWVNLMLEQIQYTSRRSDITNALNAAPQELDKMIRHVFIRIATDASLNKADLNEILIWVTCAQERFRLGEMDTILKLRPPLGEGMPDLEDRLRRQFASFFTLSREDNLSTEQLQLRLQEERREKLLQEQNHDIDEQTESATPQDDLDDEDGGLDVGYDSPFESTYLEFSHASIRDYLVQEGTPETRKWPRDLGVGIEVTKAHHHITVVLLNVLCDKEHKTTFVDNGLDRYAADQCLFHLQRLDRSTLSKSERQAIVHPLFTLFHNDAVIGEWLFSTPRTSGQLIEAWLRDDKMSECVRGWFTDEIINDSGFTSEEKSQLQIAATSTAALFKPMAQVCANRWVGPGVDDSSPEFYVLFLNAYLALGGSDTSDVTVHGISVEKAKLSDVPLSRFRLLADFGDFERSATWHRRLAKIMRDAGYINAALNEFDKSLEKNCEDWQTMEGIALCYEAREDYVKAVEWQSKALDHMTNGDDEDRAGSLRYISIWQQALGERGSAIEKLHEAKCLLPDRLDYVYEYVILLDIDSRHEEIMDLAGNFQNDPSNRKKKDVILRLLEYPDMQKIFGKAAEALGQNDVVIGALEESLASAIHLNLAEEVSARAYGLTTLRCRHASSRNQAIQLWEELLEEVKSRQSQFPALYVMESTVTLLCQLYYDEAVAAEAGNQDFEVWISKLGILVNAHAGQQDALLLGLWYRTHERTEEARACFKTAVLQAIDILTDEYPENDDYGFELLAGVLHKAGDKQNAAAAISVSMALFEKLKAARRSRKTTSSQANAEDAIAFSSLKLGSSGNTSQPIEVADGTASSELEAKSKRQPDEANGPHSGTHVALGKFDLLDLEAQTKGSVDPSDLSAYVYSCDGECKREIEDFQEIYTCEVCSGVRFCDVCVELVKGNKLAFRICNPDHSFWQIYPSDAKLLDIATERVDGKTMPRAAWLEKLREEWAF